MSMRSCERLRRVERLVVRIRPRLAVDETEAVLRDFLVHEGRRDRQLIVHLPQQRGANAGHDLIVDVVKIGRDRRGRHVAAGGRVDRSREVPRRDDLAVDPAAQVLLRADDAQRQRVGQRQIDHGVFAVVQRVAAVGVSGDQFAGCIEGTRIRGVGDQLDRAAHGAGTIERALRAAQHFDAIEVVQVGVDDDLAVLCRRRRRQRHVVEIEAHRG